MFEDFGNGDKVTSVDVEKSVSTALVKALEASWVSSIDDPRLKSYGRVASTTALCTLILVAFFRCLFFHTRL